MISKRLHTDRAILALAVPAIINNVTVPLLGLCDTAIAGHLGNAKFIAALAVGTMMINVIYWLCGFLRMGTSGMTAQAFGACNYDRMHRILRRSLLIGTTISVAVILIQIPLLKLLVLIISPEPEVSEFASVYFRVGIWGTPAQLAIMAASGWLIGRQNTIVPMAISIGVNVVNIASSLLLVYVFGLGFYGIVVGTLIACYVGAIAILAMSWRIIKQEKKSCRASVTPIVTSENSVKIEKSFLSVNLPLFFRSACIMCVTMGMTSVGARLGATTLAANAVIMQFFLFFSYFMDGFAFAGEALVGKYVGADDRESLKQSVRGLLRWGIMMAVIFFLAYNAGGEYAINLLTDSEEVRSAAQGLHIWMVILPPITVASFIFDGIYIGMARTQPLLWCTVVASVAFFMITLIGGKSDNMLLWVAFETYLLLRGVLLGLEYIKIQRKSLIL